MIDGLDRMNLEEVIDWFELLQANDDAEYELRQRPPRK